MTTATPLPDHYRSTIRAFVRLALIGISVGMILGIWWTDYRQKVAYTAGEPAAVHKEGSKVEMELPPGLNFEAGLKLKLSHGHTILITGVLPICFAMCLFMANAMGGREAPAGPLKAAFWLYTVGAVGAVTIITYRGAASFSAIHAALEAGRALDLQAIQAGLFGGSRAIKGLAYGTTHTVMAVGAGILVYHLWRATKDAPVAPSPAEPAAPEPAPEQ